MLSSSFFGELVQFIFLAAFHRSFFSVSKFSFATFPNSTFFLPRLFIPLLCKTHTVLSLQLDHFHYHILSLVLVCTY